MKIYFLERLKMNFLMFIAGIDNNIECLFVGFLTGMVMNFIIMIPVFNGEYSGYQGVYFPTCSILFIAITFFIDASIRHLRYSNYKYMIALFLYYFERFDKDKTLDILNFLSSIKIQRECFIFMIKKIEFFVYKKSFMYRVFLSDIEREFSDFCKKNKYALSSILVD